MATAIAGSDTRRLTYQVDRRSGHHDGRQAEHDDYRARRAQTLLEEHGDFLKEAVALVATELMEAEISAEVGAGLEEVAPDSSRLTYRNGYRPRAWETRVGELEPLIPRRVRLRVIDAPNLGNTSVTGIVVARLGGDVRPVRLVLGLAAGSPLLRRPLGSDR